MTMITTGNSTQATVAILHQGFIPVYRVNFFRTLNQIGATKYLVFHGSPPSDTAHKEFQDNPDFPNVRIKNVEFALFGKKIIYQPVITKILFGSVDAVILGHEIRFLSNLALFGLCKILRRPVVWWGQGFQKAQITRFTGPLSFRLITFVKDILARLADMYIVYTEGGAAKLQEAGVPKEKIRVVRNTIDMQEQCALHAELTDADPLQLRAKLNLRPDSKVLLYIGRIYKEKKVDELVKLVKRLNAEKLCGSFVEAVIVGDGPEVNTLKVMAAGADGVHLVGELYDQRAVAEYMRIASAVVIPGKVGLAVNHAFSQGVPVITREHDYHGPEREYIVHGKNGLIIGGDFDNFVTVTAEHLNSPEREKAMAQGALVSRDSLTLEFMVTAFDEAVTTAINRRRRGVSRASEASYK